MDKKQRLVKTAGQQQKWEIHTSALAFPSEYLQGLYFLFCGEGRHLRLMGRREDFLSQKEAELLQSLLVLCKDTEVIMELEDRLFIKDLWQCCLNVIAGVSSI